MSENELDSNQIGSDAWMERLDILAGDAYGLAADLLQQKLQREFDCSEDMARLMALTELERVTESQFAELREHIHTGTQENIRLLKAFRAFEVSCALPNVPNVPPQMTGTE